HSPTVDPFKGVLFKLMGRLEPDKRNVPYVTATTEDWLWFQLAMVWSGNETNGLKELAEVLMGYGERHFEGTPGQKGTNARYGTWARVLLICGQFERVCSRLWNVVAGWGIPSRRYKIRA
ncbi:hypothetical protein K439DRAFT_1378282, partial [Ramaria rubella]